MQLGHTINVLDHGYVRLIDFMGSDQRIVESARISYKSKSKGVEQDKKLLHYLYKHRHCYHPNMEVLTAFGWKKWFDCKDYEYFVIPNPKDKTYSIEYLKVLRYNVENEIMEGFKNSRMSYLVTPEHKMWFAPKSPLVNKDGGYNLIEACKINGWGHFEPASNYFFSSENILDPKFQLIGFYLGDGFQYSKNIIAFRLVKQRKIEYLEAILNLLKIPFLKNGRNLTSSQKQIWEFKIEKKYLTFADLYIDFSLKASDKYFNERELLQLTPSEKMSLLDGLINSDGSIKKDRPQIEFVSMSERLANLVETLASFFNYDAHKARGFGAFRIKIYKNVGRTTLEARKQYFYKQKYSGEVFCTTSSTGLLVVRGNSNEFSFISGNSSPFEMCKITFNIKMPIFVMRQYIRHRVQNLNEISFRYSEAPSEFYIPLSWRKQDTKNKQGSIQEENWNPVIYPSNQIVDVDDRSISDIPDVRATELLNQFCKSAYKNYEKMIKAGVAKEMARMILPVNLYTEIYCCWDLRNLLHFITLREDSHAQAEIQVYAKAMKDIAKELFPWTFEAYAKYKWVLKEEESAWI